MKKGLFLVLAILLIGQVANTQILVNGKKVNLDNLKYMEIEFVSLVGSNQVRVFIDYGQEINFLDRKKRQLSDRNGKNQVFNSKIQGLNYFYANGWRVKEVYNPRTGGDTVSNDLFYLLEKIE